MTLLKDYFWIFRSSPISWGVFSYSTKKIELHKQLSLSKMLYSCLILAHHFALTVHIKRKLLRASHGRHSIIVIFSNPWQLHLIYRLCCKVSRSYVMQTVNILEVAVEIFPQNPNMNLCQNQKKPGFSICRSAADSIASKTLQMRSKKFSFFFFIWMTVFWTTMDERIYVWQWQVIG